MVFPFLNTCTKYFYDLFIKQEIISKKCSLPRFDEAIDIYDSIIRQDETNSTARKRKVAVLRGQGKIPEAIRELTEYLKK